jgi:hypothetical protein
MADDAALLIHHLADSAGIGLAAGRVHGSSTEYLAATDVLWGVIDPSAGYSGCGGQF